MILLYYSRTFEIHYYLMLHIKLGEILSSESSTTIFLVLLYSLVDSFMAYHLNA